MLHHLLIKETLIFLLMHIFKINLLIKLRIYLLLEIIIKINIISSSNNNNNQFTKIHNQSKNALKERLLVNRKRKK